MALVSLIPRLHIRKLDKEWRWEPLIFFIVIIHLKVPPTVLLFPLPEKDHVVLDYGQRVKLLAFHKQEKMGPYATEKDADTGYFDVMGSDRR